uniref:Uncharacterized protein n=2 Tax=Anguilla anguilla TaxID=7936 RepID=A0A0E9W4J4_ANGAN
MDSRAVKPFGTHTHTSQRFMKQLRITFLTCHTSLVVLITKKIVIYLLALLPHLAMSI